jgi:hypothetical protein
VFLDLLAEIEGSLGRDCPSSLQADFIYGTNDTMTNVRINKSTFTKILPSGRLLHENHIGHQGKS